MKNIKRLKTALFACVLLSVACFPVLSIAQKASTNTPVDILPAKTLKTGAPAYNQSNNTHPPLKMTPDKSELIRLNEGAGSIIIGAPAHLSVLADSSKTLILVPKLPGATYVTILNKKGHVIMQRHVLVGSPKEKYVRIRKSCSAGQDGCKPTQVYYCPDMCHEVNIAQEETGSQSADAGGQGNNGAAPQPVQDNSGTEGN